jgi:hypothetical protein
MSTTSVDVGDRNQLRMLNDIIEIDFDAIEAFEAAIERLGDADRSQLHQFLADHRRHAVRVAELVSQLGGTPVSKADFRRLVTRGRVLMGGLLSDQAVLKAVRSNEAQIAKAYAFLGKNPAMPYHGTELFAECLADERLHQAWLDRRIDELQPTVGP